MQDAYRYIMSTAPTEKGESMKREQIIEELQTIKDYFTEDRGAYPLALEEAQRAIQHGISSRVISVMTYYDDIDLESIDYDESFIEWEHLKNFDMDNRKDVDDFFSMLIQNYGEKTGFRLLWDLLLQGYVTDFDNMVKFIANWI